MATELSGLSGAPVRFPDAVQLLVYLTVVKLRLGFDLQWHSHPIHGSYGQN